MTTAYDAQAYPRCFVCGWKPPTYDEMAGLPIWFQKTLSWPLHSDVYCTKRADENRENREFLAMFREDEDTKSRLEYLELKRKRER